MPIAARRVSTHSIRGSLAAKKGSSRQNATNSACNPAAIRTSHEAVPRNTRSAASGTAAVVTRRVSTHSIRGSLAAKQGSSRQNTTNSAHHRAAVAPHRYCFAILPRRARRVAEASPCRAAWSLSAAPSLRRLPPRRRPVALLHHRPGPQHETRHPEVPRAICYVRSAS